MAGECAAAGIELAQEEWLALFDDMSDHVDGPVRLLAGLGPALCTLFRLGHFDALFGGVRRWLDPGLDGERAVLEFLDDPGVAEALSAMTPGTLRAGRSRPLSDERAE